MTDSEAPVVRLDLWLWAARFYRTRSLAKHAIETGKVDVAGQRAKPSRTFITVNMPPISMRPNGPFPPTIGKVLSGIGISIFAISAMPRAPIG